MKNKILQLFVKTILIVIGCFTLSIAIDFFFKSNVGGDPMAVFIQGASSSFNLEAGYITNISNIVLIILIAIFDYKKIGVGTIIIVAGYGTILNFVLSISILPYSSNVITSIIYCLAACIIASFSISLWLRVKFGYSPLEGLLTIFSEKSKISFTIYKVAIDLILLTSGFLLGGVILYGTLIASILIGPLIGMFTKLYNRVGFLKYCK